MACLQLPAFKDAEGPNRDRIAATLPHVWRVDVSNRKVVHVLADRVIAFLATDDAIGYWAQTFPDDDTCVVHFSDANTAFQCRLRCQ